MPRISPFRILLSREELRELTRRANKYTLPYYQVVRAKMILLAHKGLSNDNIADQLATRREIVSMWRKRFFEQRLLPCFVFFNISIQISKSPTERARKTWMMLLYQWSNTLEVKDV